MIKWFKGMRLHQKLVLSPCLFVMLTDRLTDGSPWTDDTVISSESREQVKDSLRCWT